MTRLPARHERWIWALVACFVGGTVVGWSLRGGAPVPSLLRSTTAVNSRSKLPQPQESQWPEAPVPPAPAAVAVATAPPGSAAADAAAVTELRQRHLRVPIDGTDVNRWKRMFEEGRGSGRPHEAVDILAPRGTPVHAVDGGKVAKLFHSKAGGNTVYQFDSEERFCYYYAHLDRYASLREGQQLASGDIVGYVGTSGNAPAGTPHLHFAIFELGPERRWWEGRALDPYLVFQQASR